MIEGIFYIEAQGKDKRIVKGALDALTQRLKADDCIKVRKEAAGEVVEEGDNFSSMTEVELEFKDFESYVKSAIKYAPSAVHILGPEKLVVKAEEFLHVLGEVIRIAKMFYKKCKFGLDFGRIKGSAEIGLDDDEIDELMKQGAIRAKIVVQAGNKSRERIVKELTTAGEGDLIVSKAKSKKVGAPGAGSLLGVEVFVYGPKVLFSVAVKRTPVLVEIVEPAEIKLTMLDLQEIGLGLASFFFEASNMFVARRAALRSKSVRLTH